MRVSEAKVQRPQATKGARVNLKSVNPANKMSNQYTELNWL